MDTDFGPDIFQNATRAANFLKDQLPESLRVPKLGIVCGSGLGRLSESVDAMTKVEISYENIPYFPRSTVLGHSGKLVFGNLDLTRCASVLMLGTNYCFVSSFYEGHTIQDVAFPIRVLTLLGIKTLISTNAAGALNPEYRVGDVVLLADHLNLAGLAGIHPLRGPNLAHFGTRFPPLSDAYELGLRRSAHQAWSRLDCSDTGSRLHEGVYAFAGGPSYETRAECRALRSLGADLVGMSTIPEIIVARHSGVKVLAMSLITNKAQLDAGPAGNDPRVRELESHSLQDLNEAGIASHEEVLEVGKRAAGIVQELVASVARDVLRNQASEQ